MTTPKWYNSLRVQIVLLLTLALFPLGAVAIYQTNRVQGEADRNAELALLALTSRAAKSEELILERAFGVAGFFASLAEDFVNDPDRCTRDLQRFIRDSDVFSFIGILPLSGVMVCSSSQRTYDFSNWPGFDEAVAAGTRTITVNQQAPLSGESVFVISEPFDIGGTFGGFISISVPHNGLPETSTELVDLGLKELITFNAQGEILTARGELDSAVQETPQDYTLQDLKGTFDLAFSGLNQWGERRTFTVVPIEGSPATVMGVWGPETSMADRLGAFIKPAVFPILMWFASMTVAMLSIYTLVLRHVARLRKNMDDFAETRAIDTSRGRRNMPNEFQALARNFDRMTDDIMREEAQLEDMVREKNVLIKEVHHRVKNNLQLISSIMNMQIRTAQQDETKSVLRRLQDRVLSLATIHRDLYQSQHGGMVNVGALVSEIVEKSIEIAVSADHKVEITTDIDPVLLYPDQAVPLSLLAAESMTNAMKYIGTRGPGKPSLAVSLKQDGQDCVLTMANSVGDVDDADGTGLGAQLMNAFAIQLRGKITTEEADGVYTMGLRFAIEEFEPETRDF